MRIAMIGTGYVGLVSGACFSEFGWDVCCVDKDAGKIDALMRIVFEVEQHRCIAHVVNVLEAAMADHEGARR